MPVSRQDCRSQLSVEWPRSARTPAAARLRTCLGALTVPRRPLRGRATLEGRTECPLRPCETATEVPIWRPGRPVLRPCGGADQRADHRFAFTFDAVRAGTGRGAKGPARMRPATHQVRLRN